jgi:leucyl/phenylalanyl-tRNA--protein transferase
MVQAYQRLHRAGHAHSAEVWLDGQLVAGLYFVCLGKAVFGESMFTQISDGSKMALSALVHVCQRHGIAQIDCQQNTPHLASLGAQEMPRSAFLAHMTQHLEEPSPDWTAQALDGREFGRAYGRAFGRSLAAMESFP